MSANIRYWRSVLAEAERELDAATGRSTLNDAARKLLLAKQQLRALSGGTVEWSGTGGRFLITCRSSSTSKPDSSR